MLDDRTPDYDYDDHNSIPTVETPLPKNRDSKLHVAIGILITVPVLVIIAMMVFIQLGSGKLPAIICAIMLGVMSIGIPVVLFVYPVRKKKYLEKVCTTRVRGKFCGYDKIATGQRGDDRRHLFAPKYLINFDDYYEIRTIDDFSTTKYEEDQQTIDLLINPKGYEAIRAVNIKKKLDTQKFAIVVAALFGLAVMLIPILLIIKG